MNIGCYGNFSFIRVYVYLELKKKTLGALQTNKLFVYLEFFFFFGFTYT